MNKNINVIDGASVNGNIGSCRVQSDEVTVGNSLFMKTYQSVQINSCSGEIISTNQYHSYGGLWFGIVVGISALLIALNIYSDY